MSVFRSAASSARTLARRMHSRRRRLGNHALSTCRSCVARTLPTLHAGVVDGNLTVREHAQMSKRSEELEAMARDAIESRKKRPSDLLSVRGHAQQSLREIGAVRHACEEHLRNHLPVSDGTVERQLAEARDEEIAIGEVLRLIEQELGMAS